MCVSLIHCTMVRSMDLRLKELVKGIEIDRNNSAYMPNGVTFIWKEIFCSSVKSARLNYMEDGRPHQNSIDSKPSVTS